MDILIITVNFLTEVRSIVFDLKGKSADGKGMVVSNVSFDGGSVKWIHEGDRIHYYS